MLKKFRQNSKAKAQPHRDNLEQAPSSDVEQRLPRTGFFCLPAELRNEIYELVARQTDLQLVEPRRQKGFGTKKPLPSAHAVPGLWLTSRQVRFESFPVLLRNATITAKVLDFDFAPLSRVIKSLGSIEQESLQSNTNLRITLRMKKCGNNVASGLRAWCVGGVTSDPLPWHYKLDESNAEDIRQGQAGAVRWYAVRAGVLVEQEKDSGVRKEVTKVLEVLYRALDEEMTTGPPRNDPVLMTSSWRPGMYL